MKFIKFCYVCQNLSVSSTQLSDGFESTGKEYIEGEKWIQSIIDKLKPEYSIAQKIAIIDYEIGNRILNNLPHILKSKGTRQSIYSLMNCYGITDNMVQLIQQGGAQVQNGTNGYNTYVTNYAINIQSESYLQIP